MITPLVYFDRVPHVVLRQVEDWGVRVLDLAAPPRRLLGTGTGPVAAIRTNIDPFQTQPCPLPSQLLAGVIQEGDTWSALTKRSLARFEAFFLACEDPQKRLDAREVVTLAHQVSLVRHILDSPNRRRVLIGDEVGLGKTVVAGLILQELLAKSPGLRVLYLAPARLVSNVAREFQRLSLFFREWKAHDGDARIESDNRVIASIHKAVHPNHFRKIVHGKPWDIIIVDECHHLTDWSPGGGDPVQKYRLVRDLVANQPPESRLLLLSGTPHQAHTARFENLLRLLKQPGEHDFAAASRVIYRTKEDVRDWEGNPLFPKRKVNPPTVVELDPPHRAWLAAIHNYFKPSAVPGNDQRQRAAGWKCAQALQWATSSPNAGLGYLVRQAIRAGWNLNEGSLRNAIAALRPYRSGSSNQPVEDVFRRLRMEVGQQAEDDDIEDIEEGDLEDDDVDHEALDQLIRQGIDLVLSSKQQKWERLWKEIIEPAAGGKVVLFAQPIETVLALATWLEKKCGQKPAIIIGGQTDVERDQQVATFRDSKGPQFLISSKAGGEGINLQFSRRLVHLDVPWNPMEMEQRVGRVHRFGSRETIIVDTLVVRESRETQAWRVARERLNSIANTLVSPERFETVFSRVMCLIPPEELQSVLINSPASPLQDNEVRRLSSLVDSGFRDWQSFHEKYAANQKEIRDQPAGLARWSHLKDFLIAYGEAQGHNGVAQTKFVQKEHQVVGVEAKAEVIKLRNGKLYFVGDYEGGLFSGSQEPIEPLGLNIPIVSQIVSAFANPSLPTGAAHLRWGDDGKKLREQFGEELMLYFFARQTFRLDSIGGATEVGLELIGYALTKNGCDKLSEGDKANFFDLSRWAVVRVKPTESRLMAKAQEKELELLDQLRRPSEDEIRQGFRFAVWPLLIAHLSP